MLLSYVALAQGDAVGALTFGTPAGDERRVRAAQGRARVERADGRAVLPCSRRRRHSDYVAAAQDLLRRHRKRSLVIVITNFRDEDGSELGQALKLLRSRHLVLLASLRERIVGELMAQPPAIRRCRARRRAARICTSSRAAMRSTASPRATR